MGVHFHEPHMGLNKTVGFHKGLEVCAALEVDGQVVIHEALDHQPAPAWLIAV